MPESRELFAHRVMKFDEFSFDIGSLIMLHTRRGFVVGDGKITHDEIKQ